MEPAPLEGSGAEELWDKHGLYNSAHHSLSSPTTTAHLAWAGVKGPGSAPRLH